MLVSLLIQVLRTKLRSSAKAVCGLNYRDVPLAQKDVCVCVYGHNLKGCHSFNFYVRVKHGVMGSV